MGDRRRGGAAAQFVSSVQLDRQPADEIQPDLTARRDGAPVDLTEARHFPENAGVAFMGDTTGGPFDVSGDVLTRHQRRGIEAGFYAVRIEHGGMERAIRRAWCCNSFSLQHQAGPERHSRPAAGHPPDRAWAPAVAVFP